MVGVTERTVPTPNSYREDRATDDDDDDDGNAINDTATTFISCVLSTRHYFKCFACIRASDLHEASTAMFSFCH